MDTEESLIGVEAGRPVLPAASSSAAHSAGLRTVALVPCAALSACVFGLSAANGVLFLRGAVGQFSEALAQEAALALEKRPCHTAAPEDSDAECYNQIAAVLADDARAIREHPEEYPGLSPSSVFEEVQRFLHERRASGSHCPLPCSVGTCHIATKDDVDQTCFRATSWAINGDIHTHPDRYPGLSTSSGFVDFQKLFHDHRPEMKCPSPCLAPHPAFYGAAWTLLGGIASLPAFVVFCDWARSKPDWRYRFFSLYLAMLVPLNTQIYDSAKWGFTNNPSHYEQYGYAWRWFAPCWFFAYAWALVTIGQHLHIPTAVPRSRQTLWGLLGLYVALANSVFFVCCARGTAESAPGFLSFSQSLLPLMSLMLAEAVRLVNTAETQGVLALLPMLVCLSTATFWLLRGHARMKWTLLEKDYLFYFVVISAADALLLLLAAGDLRSRPLSTSWHFAGAGDARESRCSTSMHCLMSWRGQNILYLTNGLFSFSVYGSARALRAGIRMAPWASAGAEAFNDKNNFVDAAIVLSGMSVLLPVVGLLSDLPVRSRVLRSMLSRIPIDRHFRYTTVIKVALLWMQLEILVCTNTSSEAGILVLCQVVAALGSLLVGIFAPFAMVMRAGRLLRLTSRFQGGHLLFVAAMTFSLAAQFFVCVLLVGKIMGPDGAVMRGLKSMSAGSLLALPCTYLLGFSCLSNELRWTLAALDMRTPHFSAVCSPSGVWALASFVAVTFPLQVLLDFVYNQWLWPWYIQDLFTGLAAPRPQLWGGGTPLAGVLPPFAAYGTLAAALAAACAGWAAGSPLAGGMMTVAPMAALAHAEHKESRQQDGHHLHAARGPSNAGDAALANRAVVLPVTVDG